MTVIQELPFHALESHFRPRAPIAHHPHGPLGPTEIDVLANNAGSGDSPLPIVDVEPERWWYIFVGDDCPSPVCKLMLTDTQEAMGNGTFLMTQQIQLQNFVVAEDLNARAVSLHPSIVMTRMTPPAFHRFARHTFELIDGVAVWLASDQAGFMNRRYMSVDWSVDEQLKRKDEIVSNGLLEVGL